MVSYDFQKTNANKHIYFPFPVFRGIAGRVNYFATWQRAQFIPDTYFYTSTELLDL